MIVGREVETGVVAAALAAAREGRGTARCFVGDGGIGKSTLLDAAEQAAQGFAVLHTVGVDSDLTMGHAGLADLLAPVRDCLPDIPVPQREALEAALGWAGTSTGQRFLVAAGTLSLLAAAAARRPLLVLVDDLQWVDRETVSALLFAARRLSHDPVAVVMASRTTPTDGAGSAVAIHPVTGLDAAAARELLPARVADRVVAQLVAQTGGNPMAMIESARWLTPAQQRGASPMPEVIPLNQRLASAFGQALGGLSPPARRLLVLAAASTDVSAGPVVGAMAHEGLDSGSALDEAERADLVTLRAGELAFRHPLVRAAVWLSAAPSEKRSAHESLALTRPPGSEAWVRHISQATVGYDDEVARRLLDVAQNERGRRGYAAAADLEERAGQLSSAPDQAAACRAAAVEDAFLGGDMSRVRDLAAAVLAGPAGEHSRGRALLWLGTLEQYAGSVPAARDLLQEAATVGSRDVRLRAVVELGHVGYRLNLPEAVSDAARIAADVADQSDPEQEMLVCYLHGTALAFAGRWDEALAPMARAWQLLEGEPALRDEPRYLAMAMLAVGWADVPATAVEHLERRLAGARASGALGVLPLALSLVAGAAGLHGDQQLAYASAGEAVELGTELGYVADVAIGHELLAWQAAARGQHAHAREALQEARRLATISGTTDAAVHVHLVDAFAALCRGDLDRTIAVLERRMAVDGGRLARGDYPLGVAADLVEAYLGTGRGSDAADLARRHDELHGRSPDPDIRALAARLRGLVATDEAVAGAAFDQAHRDHAAGRDAFEAARTRLLHGARLRRAGRRVEARDHLEISAGAFRAMGLDGWTARAEGELAASGRTARRGARKGDQLTAQETRVVLLVARGRSNREIAAALFLSPKTVEHHVTSALRKRGLRSRTELAVAFRIG